MAYDDLGRRTSLTRGNGTSSAYSYDGIGRLATLAQDLTVPGSDVTFALAYNPAGEIVTRSGAHGGYAYQSYANGGTATTHNGLNQIVTSGGASVTHDARGNVTAIGSTGYGYDSENRLSVATAISGGYIIIKRACTMRALAGSCRRTRSAIMEA